MKTETILAAITAGGALIPEVRKLIEDVTELLSADDKAMVVARLDAEADAAHAATQAG